MHLCRCGVQQFQRDPDSWRRRAGSADTLRSEFASVMSEAGAGRPKAERFESAANAAAAQHDQQHSIADHAQPGPEIDLKSDKKTKKAKRRKQAINDQVVVGPDQVLSMSQTGRPKGNALDSLLTGTHISAIG